MSLTDCTVIQTTLRLWAEQKWFWLLLDCSAQRCFSLAQTCAFVFCCFLFVFASFLLRPHFHTGHKRWSIGKWSIIFVRAFFCLIVCWKSNKSEPSLWHSLTSDWLPQRLFTGALLQSQTPASQWKQQQVGYYTYVAYRSAYRGWQALVWRSNALNRRVGRGTMGGRISFVCFSAESI